MQNFIIRISYDEILSENDPRMTKVAELREAETWATARPWERKILMTLQSSQNNSFIL